MRGALSVLSARVSVFRPGGGLPPSERELPEVGSWNPHIQCPAGMWCRGWFQEPRGRSSDKEDGSGRQLLRLATRMLRAERGLFRGNRKTFQVKGWFSFAFCLLSFVFFFFFFFLAF